MPCTQPCALETEYFLNILAKCSLMRTCMAVQVLVKDIASGSDLQKVDTAAHKHQILLAGIVFAHVQGILQPSRKA